METYLASKVTTFEPWTSQSASVQYNTLEYDPSYYTQGYASQAAQNTAFADALTAAASDSPGEFADYALNPTGTVPNPLIDFEMPDCWGLSVSECQDVISEAADAVDKTVSFSVTTAPAENSDVARDLVLSTFPAASSVARPDVVTLTQNPSTAPQMRCTTVIDNPHYSEHDPSVLMSGKVRCNYTGSSSYYMWLWQCSDLQTSDPLDLFDDVFGGSFGCQLEADRSGTVSVTAGSLLNPNIGTPIHCPDYATTGYVDWGSGFWIGASVTTNAAPVQNDPPKISPAGLTIPEPS
jgi:hypothetical protein